MPDDESSTDEETALTRTSSAALQRLDTNLEATERVLARGEDRYVRFFRKHPEFFVDLLSRWHPINTELLERYANAWNWELLSKNENLCWSEEVVQTFEHRWDWKALSSNESLPWAEEFIEVFKKVITFR